MGNETHGEHASDRADDDELDAIVAKLKPKFSDGDLPLSDGDVKDAVRDAAEELRDAPVQTFVPLITENNARNRLQKESNE